MHMNITYPMLSEALPEDLVDLIARTGHKMSMDQVHSQLQAIIPTDSNDIYARFDDFHFDLERIIADRYKTDMKSWGEFRRFMKARYPDLLIKVRENEASQRYSVMYALDRNNIYVAEYAGYPDYWSYVVQIKVDEIHKYGYPERMGRIVKMWGDNMNDFMVSVYSVRCVNDFLAAMDSVDDMLDSMVLQATPTFNDFKDIGKLSAFLWDQRYKNK